MINKLRRLINGDDKLKLAAGQIFVGNGDGDASAVALTGVGTIDSAGSIAIGTAKITGTMINSLVVSAGHLANATVSVSKLAASAVTAAKLAYKQFTVSLPVGDASTTSCYCIYSITSGAKLVGAWLQTMTSHHVGSFAWWVQQGTNSIHFYTTSLSGMTTSVIFQGVVIEP